MVSFFTVTLKAFPKFGFDLNFDPTSQATDPKCTNNADAPGLLPLVLALIRRTILDHGSFNHRFGLCWPGHGRLFRRMLGIMSFASITTRKRSNNCKPARCQFMNRALKRLFTATSRRVRLRFTGSIQEGVNTHKSLHRCPTPAAARWGCRSQFTSLLNAAGETQPTRRDVCGE